MTSGIYMIKNKTTGDRYIGSSIKIEHRWAVHLYDMRTGNRGNYKLRKDYLKYGVNIFEWSILEIVEYHEDIEKREQFWLDSIKPEYNIRVTATNFLPSKTEVSALAHKRQSEKMRGRKQSEEEKQKRSESFQRRWADPIWRESHKAKLKKTSEQKEVLRQLATGENNGNWGTKRPKEFRDLISRTNSIVQYTFVSPEGKEITFSNLLGRGEEMTGLKYWQLRQLYRGRKESFDGWTFKEKTSSGYKKER